MWGGFTAVLALGGRLDELGLRCGKSSDRLRTCPKSHSKVSAELGAQQAGEWPWSTVASR